jgi:hypothetical protein
MYEIDVLGALTQLLCYKSCQVLLQGPVNPFANGATRGHGGFDRGHGGICGHSGRGSNNNSRPPNSFNNNHGHSNNNGKSPTCQVCEKDGHTAIQC